MISIIYSTNRKNPKFEWFRDSLLLQMTDDDLKNVEIIMVDYCYDPQENWNNPLEPFKGTITKPKQNIYQGPGRLTKTEMFSPSNARNTGAMLSSGDYLVFIDDVGLCMPGWWNAVKQSAQYNMIVCGAYQKHWEMVVEGGKLISSRSEQNGIDSRWNQGNNFGPVGIQGSQLFGCSFGIPYKDFISVNGFDEICDSIGGEDYQFGLRLNNAGKQIFYDRRMLTIESEELHDQDYKMLREDRVISPEQYMLKLLKYGVHRRYIQGNWDSSHMILDILHGMKQTWTIGNNYTISDQRNKKQLPEKDFVNVHWFDDKPLSEI